MDLYETATGGVPAPTMSGQEISSLDAIFNLIEQNEAIWGLVEEDYLENVGDFGVRKVVTEGEWHETPGEYSEYEKDVMAAAEHAWNWRTMMSNQSQNYKPEEDEAYTGILNSVLLKYGIPTTSANRNNLITQGYHLALNPPTASSYQDPDKIEYVKLTEEEWREQASPEEILDYDTRMAAKERHKKALAGELPISEIGEKKKAEEKKLTIEALKRKGISENSTAWIQTMSEFEERWARINQAEQYGEIGQGTEGILKLAALSAQNIGNIGATYTGLAGGTQGLMQNYAGYMQPYTAYNMAGYQAQAANQAASAGLLGSLFGAGGSLAGLGLGGWLGS